MGPCSKFVWTRFRSPGTFQNLSHTLCTEFTAVQTSKKVERRSPTLVKSRDSCAFRDQQSLKCARNDNPNIAEGFYAVLWKEQRVNNLNTFKIDNSHLVMFLVFVLSAICLSSLGCKLPLLPRIALISDLRVQGRCQLLSKARKEESRDAISFKAYVLGFKLLGFHVDQAKCPTYFDSQLLIALTRHLTRFSIYRSCSLLRQQCATLICDVSVRWPTYHRERRHRTKTAYR